MHNATMIAIAAQFEKDAKTAKPLLPQETEWELDETVTLRVVGTVKKGADNEYIPTASIPIKMALALFIEKMGFMREHAMRLLVEAMNEALTRNDLESNEAIQERMRNIEASMERVQLMVGRLEPQVRNGSVRVKATVEEIRQEEPVA